MLSVIVLSAVSGNWPTWGADPAHTGLQLMVGRMVDTAVVKWALLVGDTEWVEWQYSAVDDVDGDGAAEVLFTATNHVLYCVDGATGTVEWSYSLSKGKLTIGQTSSPTVADLDGDGSKEIIVGKQNGGVYCLSASGNLKWYSPTGATVSTGVPVGDLDGDGVLEAVVGSDTDTVYCFDGATGAVEWKFAAKDRVFSTPAIADVNGDGELEVLFGDAGTTDGGDSTLYCLRGSDGSVVWTAKLSGPIGASPTASDVDGDGEMEVLIATYDGVVYSLSGADGSVEWSTSLPGSSESSPSVADVDGDGVEEVFIGYSAGVASLKGNDGSTVWTASVGGAHTPGALADVDGDGTLEYIPSSRGSTLNALNAENGSVAWSIVLGEDIHTPFVADIDDDGRAEILVGTRDPDAEGHTFFAIDDINNSADCGLLTKETGDGKPSPWLRAVAGKLLLRLPRPGKASLKLYDPSGRLARVLWDGAAPSGSYAFPLSGVRPGVYVATLEFEGERFSVKVVKR